MNAHLFYFDQRYFSIFPLTCTQFSVFNLSDQFEEQNPISKKINAPSVLEKYARILKQNYHQSISEVSRKYVLVIYDLDLFELKISCADVYITDCL